MKGAINAPNNGPSYSREDTCGADAALNGGISTFLDVIGAIPAEGTIVNNAIQLGAGVLSAANAISGDLQDAVGAGGGLGLSLADLSGTANLGALPGGLTQGLSDATGGFIGSEIKTIPLIGNVFSAFSAVQDWGKTEKAYNNCMEHY